MNTPSLSYQHLFQPGTRAGAPPFLLLHGTGGTERDLIPLGRKLSPGSALLSPRGDVNEYGQLRFFRRLAEGVFDLDDVARRTHALADFIDAAAGEYLFDKSRLIAVGFSNGANIAASLLLLRPGAVAGAALLRPMVVLDQPAALGSLAGVHVLIASGNLDPIVPEDHPSRLAGLLRVGGANVSLQTQANAGHNLTSADIAGTQAWFNEVENAPRD